MGCGSSNDIRHYTKVDQSIWRGNLTVHLRKATVKKDVQLVGKMDPYIKIVFGKQTFTSSVCEDGGQFPTWKNESFQMKRTSEEDVVYVQMWNKNVIQSDNFIGEGGFALTKVRKGTNGKVDSTCTIFGKRAEVGEIEFSLEFELDPECQNHPEVQAPDTTGQVIVRPKNATLQRDTIFLFGSMSPVAYIKLGDDGQASSAHVEGGKNPKWSDQLVFTRDTIARDIFTIECQNFSESDDNDQIGVGFLSITSCLVKDLKVTKTVDLYFEGTTAGNMTLELEYISDDPNAYGQQQQQQPVQQQQGQVQPQQVQPAYQAPVMPSNGQGEFRYPNGDYYQGDWVNGQKSGNGTMQYRSGMHYTGQWLNDYFHGQGTLKVSGTTYVGNFVNGKKSGQGTLQWDGQQQRYSGEWVDNKYHGIGDWTHMNGQTQKGEFVAGNRVRWVEQQATVFLAAGRCLMQGGTLPSEDGQYTLTLAYNGWIQVIHNASRQVTFQLNQFAIMPRAPFFLRLEMDGRLNAIDGSSQTYYCSRLPNTPMSGNPPFKLVMQNDGKIAVHDANGPIWFSH